ncbi:ATP-grasp domain-containing protein [Ruminococcus sp. HUN007]|uniref:ATP-grasp domain-containing protein n=1 Tax=Ruminococcus sp. HUN007 TaxID=1514668 RepID=UPI000B0EEEF0
MKVWLKTKLDKGMNMEIPHSPNMACAMYGFRELGAEIVPYHTIDEIYDKVEKEDIVLDYIDQCKEIFNKFGVEPYVPDYPETMKKYLGRKIWTDTIEAISVDESKWSAGWFVKPKKSKVFTGKIIKSIYDLTGCGNQNENYEVICSEPLDIEAEWRCFILYDRLLDVRPYGLILDSNRESYYYHYDATVLKEIMETFKSWENRPVACSMDICVTKDNRTLLVEFNDAYSLGNYGLNHVHYAKLISARWSQLLDREDEYDF